MRLRSALGSLVLALSGLAVVTTAAPAQAYTYPQDGWHATSVFDEGTTASTAVIDCQSSIIANMGGGTTYGSDSWTYTPPQVVTPTTGVIAGMGTEVNLDTGNPRVGDSFYIHVWARSVSTPCGFQGVVPVFTLPPGMSVDTAGHTVCYFDGVAENDATCPQPGSAKFQSAQATTGQPNSWQILCGYASGCYDTYYWPTVMGHGVEIAIPVKSTSTANGTITGGAVINTNDSPTFYPMTAPLSVFAGNTGTGTTPPPASPSTPTVQDPGYAYRVRYDDPSTTTSPTYKLSSDATTYGVLSRAEVFTNHVPGQVVFIRDTDRSTVAAAPTTVTGFNNGFHTQVDQWAMGSIENTGDSYQSEYDWRAAGSAGGQPGLGVVPGTTYYWRYGYLPYSNGNSPDGPIYWGDVQSFGLPAAGLTCNGLTVTVALGLGELPTSGDDVIAGTSGNDTINASSGNDTICGGGGDDTVDGGLGNDTVFGESGDDTLVGGDGNDKLRGGDGNDILLPGKGSDTAFGENGFDTVSYSDITTPYSASGVTFTGVWISSEPITGFANVSGAAGLDQIGANNPTQGHLPWPERVIGTQFGDRFSGLETGTVVIGGAGDDEMDSGPGTDTFLPGEGHDTVRGAGADVVSYADATAGVTASLTGGNASSDAITGITTLLGGPGADTLVGSSAADRIIGGGGADSIQGAAGSDQLVGGDGDDGIDAGEGDDVVDGGAGADSISGLAGNDNLNGGAGNDRIDGGDGNDVVDGGGGADSIQGAAGSDQLVGGDGDDRIDAGEGNDVVDGGAGADQVFGLAGNDNLRGSDGDDRIEAGEGNDVVDGGLGVDQVWGNGGDDTLYSGAGNDRIDAGTGNDVVDGGDGNDQVLGMAGNDRLRGGTGNDVVRGGAGNDSASGAAGNDTLWGEAGNDTLLGEAGKDRLNGAAGKDKLNGGGARDVCVGGPQRDQATACEVRRGFP